MRRQPFLDAVAERVVVFDGASGTNLQLLDLTADDFGGPALEGCNEMLVLTRPDVIAELHDAFFAVGVDVVETDTFGGVRHRARRVRHRATRAHELNVAAARIAREVATGYEADGRTRYVAGSIGPGTKLPSLGHIGFADAARRLRGAGRAACSRAASTCSSSRRAWTCCRPRRRSSAAAGP